MEDKVQNFEILMNDEGNESRNEKIDRINDKKHESNQCFEKISKAVTAFFRKVDTKTTRHIFFEEKELNVTRCSNEMLNHKYSVISFLPVVLFNQFKNFGNFFYLVMTITQFFDELKVGFLFTYIAPLSFVVLVSLLKELYDDIMRRRQDRRTNNDEFKMHKLVRKGLDETIMTTIKAKDIKIGDIIELTENQRVPADMVVLKTYNDSDDNNCFIRTDQLDGETDWKLRKAPGLTQELSISDIMQLDGFIECEPPCKLIYDFKGNIQFKDPKTNEVKTEGLNLDNTLWSSTVLASKKIVGVVIYTGNETRAKMNSSNPKYKIGILDTEINRLNAVLFIMMLLLAVILTILKIATGQTGWTLVFVFFRFIVLFCGIIPISLKVNMDISKTFFTIVINRDKSIEGTTARNSTIPEELGRIAYVFSDKTGTLTKNEMIFKKIAMESEMFGEESFEDLSLILQDECKSVDAPLVDMIRKQEDDSLMVPLKKDEGEVINTSSFLEEKKQKKKRRNRNKVIRDTITCMVLCNNVTPVVEKDTNTINYQASSPDEVALVKFADKLNMKLMYRTDTEVRMENANKQTEEYEILANFPFSSDTKRMGIVLKNKKYGHIIFYLKGAENVIEKFVRTEYKGYIRENAENLATKGLRTLVLTQKTITQEFFDEWNKEYLAALSSLGDRNKLVAQCQSKLENNMEFLCVTGVEDLLQDDVNMTLENLRNAGMKVWMLTGDKIETATCISISAGLKAKNHKIFTIKYDELKNPDSSLEEEEEGEEEDEVNPDHEEMILNLPVNPNGSMISLRSNVNENFRDRNALKIEPKKKLDKIDRLNKKLNKYLDFEKDPHIFIIDGDSLDLALKNSEELFFKAAMSAPAVVCCRCSPTQKRLIVKTIKKYTKERTAAVGDGGNDVAMIQEADVGIGIVGKEGLQASLASDYSILKFNYLNTLLLWWGRVAYKNTSGMANFVIHRGIIISLIQFIFSMLFYYNAVSLYNGMLMFGYSTVFTSFPSLSICLDEDTEKSNIMRFPALYKSLLKGRELGRKNFLWWVLKSIYQAAIIMFGAILLFKENLFLHICTVTFSCLIFAEILNVYTEIKKFCLFMIISLVGTAICYLLCLLLLRNLLTVSYIFTWDTLWKITVISIVGWLPFFLVNRIKKWLFPTTYEKLNEIEK